MLAKMTKKHWKIHYFFIYCMINWKVLCFRCIIYHSLFYTLCFAILVVDNCILLYTLEWRIGYKKETIKFHLYKNNKHFYFRIKLQIKNSISPYAINAVCALLSLLVIYLQFTLYFSLEYFMFDENICAIFNFWIDIISRY